MTLPASGPFAKPGNSVMSKSNPSSSAPVALILMGSQCPYCPAVLKALQALLASGDISELEIRNIEENPEIARELGVRSVPWVRIGNLELEGLRSEKELRDWAARAAADSGSTDWLNELLASGNFIKPLQRIKSDPAMMDALLTLFADPDTPLNTQIGISAIMEELQGSPHLTAIVDRLGELTKHTNARIRGDACYYLALSGSPRATNYIKALLKDRDAGVREIAQDSLE
jgi:glutaredoxin